MFKWKDSKQYANFEFCEKKIITFKNPYWFTKPTNLCWQKNLNKSLHILEANASECASDDIEQVIVKLLFRMW